MICANPTSVSEDFIFYFLFLRKIQMENFQCHFRLVVCCLTITQGNTSAFPQDFSSVFVEENVQFAAFAKLRSSLTPSQHVVLIYDEGLADTLLGVNVALRIYLSMIGSSSSGERPFSKWHS